MKTFRDKCNVGLYIVKLYLLDNVVEDLQVFGIPSVLEVSPYERYKCNINHATGSFQE